MSQPERQRPTRHKGSCMNSKATVSMPRLSNKKEGKRMSTLKVPGAQLSYEASGDGPLLILIPGAKGEGEVFRPLAHHLSAQYQVVIYDRRGFSQSSLDGPQDYDHRLETDAGDVRRKTLASGRPTGDRLWQQLGSDSRTRSPHPVSRAGPDGGGP